MSETKVKRRGFGEDGIYLDAARNRYMGAVSLGYGPTARGGSGPAAAGTRAGLLIEGAALTWLQLRDRLTSPPVGTRLRFRTNVDWPGARR